MKSFLMTFGTHVSIRTTSFVWLPEYYNVAYFQRIISSNYEWINYQFWLVLFYDTLTTMEANSKNKFVSAMISHILGVKVLNDPKEKKTKNKAPSVNCMLTLLRLMSPCYEYQKVLEHFKFRIWNGRIKRIFLCSH